MSEEYLDIYNEDGTPTGEQRTKKEVHQLGLWHHSAHIWFVNLHNDILIQRRAPHKDNHPNMWDISAAGHVSAGEDDNTSALREVEEELGLQLLPDELHLIGVVTQESQRPEYINREFNNIYIVKKNIEISEIRIQESEVAKVKYISLSELEEHISNNDPDFVPHPAEYKLLFAYLHSH